MAPGAVISDTMLRSHHKRLRERAVGGEGWLGRPLQPHPELYYAKS